MTKKCLLLTTDTCNENVVVDFCNGVGGDKFNVDELLLLLLLLFLFTKRVELIVRSLLTLVKVFLLSVGLLEVSLLLILVLDLGVEERAPIFRCFFVIKNLDTQLKHF